MRLLNTTTLKLESFVQDIPDYVILSHTWGLSEVEFDDIDKSYARYMPGYEKIESCCRRAKDDGFEYVWIDTCCIAKRSSTELSEAINSMYDYYQRAEICYAYLSDVPSYEDPSAPDSAFQKSRWFTRGWTLQELLASQVVEFYGLDWKFIGTKSDLVTAIHKATQIQEGVIRNPNTIKLMSIAQRFSWVALRKTTRVEDMAYCMMGLFGVNIPLVYGEGKQAFIRLQEEIVKRTTDQTFLCWESNGTNVFLSGPFCGSPEAFKHCGNIRAVYDERTQSHIVTNRGLEIRLPCKPHPDIPGEVLAFPRVQHTTEIPGYGNSVAIRFRKWPHNRYSRFMHSRLERASTSGVKQLPEEFMRIDGQEANFGPRGIRRERNIHFSRLHCMDKRLQIQWVVGGSKLNGATYIQEPFVYQSSQAYKIRESEGMGLLLGEGESSVFIAFGSQYSYSWIKTAIGVSVNEIGEGLKLALAEANSKRLDGGERKSWKLENGYTVSASMKKKRDLGLVFWNLELHVSTNEEQDVKTHCRANL